MRDDFSSRTKMIIARRVGYRCSNPKCCQITTGPHTENSNSVNVGVAAHITAASPGGSRYDKNISSKKRIQPENGIWLCQNCAKLIDSDPVRFTIQKLREWKKQAEEKALLEIEGKTFQINYKSKNEIFEKLEKIMPELLKEMKNDLNHYPLKREFVLLHKGDIYWSEGDELVYYFEEHPELLGKIRILENFTLIEDIRYNDVNRYIFAEEFVEYLTE